MPRTATTLFLLWVSVAAPAAPLLARTQWEQQSTATSPTARRGAAMTFAPGVGGALLFGGTGNPAPSNETWVYDGVDWTQLAPATSPSGRIEVEMTYDLLRGVVVLYGGSAGGASSETWEFDGVDWSLRTPATNPGGLFRNGICYDIGRARVVVYGGVGAGVGIPSNKTWEYDGVNWAQITTAANPGALDRPAMCYHAALGKTVLFGGAFSSTLFDATWTYDGVNWTPVPIAGARPSPRNAAKMVYDDLRGVCVLTGGQDATTIFADTWEFDGTAWTQQPTATQPARDHSLAFLPTRRQVVKFGGFTQSPNTLSNQTWEFGARWRAYGAGCPGSNGVPALSMPDAGRIGGDYRLVLTDLNTAPQAVAFVLGLSALPGLALDFVGLPGCAGYAFPDAFVNVTSAGGMASFTYNPTIGTVGDRIYAQALCLDPGVNPAGATVSNAVVTTLGL